MLQVTWLIIALPLLGFAILASVGRRLGDPAAGVVATVAVGASFLVSIGVYLDLLTVDAPVRSYSNRTGFELNAQQAVTDDFGLFARASINDGHKEAYEFTDINRSLSAGVSLKGGLWSRANDSIGAAFVINEISPEAQEYFADGGLGILIGDGSLAKYQPEQILETYYDLALKYGITLALDDQFIANPAYNATRGPVDVIGARFHIAY